MVVEQPVAVNIHFDSIWYSDILIQMVFFSLFDFAELNKNPVEGFSAGLVDESDIHKWEVLIIGPPDTL